MRWSLNFGKICSYVPSRAKTNRAHGEALIPEVQIAHAQMHICTCSAVQCNCKYSTTVDKGKGMQRLWSLNAEKGTPSSCSQQRNNASTMLIKNSADMVEPFRNDKHHRFTMAYFFYLTTAVTYLCELDWRIPCGLRHFDFLGDTHQLTQQPAATRDRPETSFSFLLVSG